MNSSTSSFLAKLKSDFPADFVATDPESLLAFGRDWTRIHDPKPLAILFPRTTEEVSRALKLCTQYQIAVVPSGGRTGLSGGAIAAKGEVVLSLTKMNKIGKVDPLAFTVHVQAGAVTEAVHEACAEFGLTWPVSFASKGSSHVGGNISTNAGGVNVVRNGLTRNWVLGLQVVLMAGEVLELGGALEKNNTGYDLKQLFIGSEGTLGIITEASLKLCRLVEEKNVFFFAVNGFDSALQLFLRARSQGPFQVSAFEYFTQNCLDAVLSTKGGSAPLATKSEDYVLLEAEPTHGKEAMESWLAELFDSGMILDGVMAQSEAEAKHLWSLRENISESLCHMGIVHKNDISLPIAKLGDFLAKLRAAYTSAYPGIGVYTFGHLGDGNLHVSALKPSKVSKEEFVKLCHGADDIMYRLVQEHQGSISAEHGVGLLKKDHLHFSRTSREIELFRSLKRVFDPQGLLNPGKIFDPI